MIESRNENKSNKKRYTLLINDSVNIYFAQYDNASNNS